MVAENDNDVRSSEEECPLDPALAARLRVAEAEVRSHLDAGIWTPRRIMTLVLIVIVAAAIGIGVLYFGWSAGHAAK